MARRRAEGKIEKFDPAISGQFNAARCAAITRVQRDTRSILRQRGAHIQIMDGFRNAQQAQKYIRRLVEKTDQIQPTL